MEIKSGRMSSDTVRRNWRDVMDYVDKGNHVVVSRSGKPVVALIPIGDFQALINELDDLHENRLVEKSLAEDAAAGDPVATRVIERRAEVSA